MNANEFVHIRSPLDSMVGLSFSIALDLIRQLWSFTGIRC